MTALFRFASCCLAFATTRAARLNSVGGTLDSEMWVKPYVKATERCSLEVVGASLCNEAKFSATGLEKAAADPENYATGPQWKESLQDAQTKMDGLKSDRTYSAKNGYNRHTMASAGKQMLAEAFELNLNVSKPILFKAVQSFVVSAEGAHMSVLGLADAVLIYIKHTREQSNYESGKRWAGEQLAQWNEALERADKDADGYNLIRDATSMTQTFYDLAADRETYTGDVLDQDTVIKATETVLADAQEHSPGGRSDFLSYIKNKGRTLIVELAAHGFDVSNLRILSSFVDMIQWQSRALSETQMGQHQATYGMYVGK